MKIRSLVTLIALAAPCCALAAMPPSAASRIAIPGGAHGIGFDDIGFAPALGRITVPAGATGNLVLIDPANDALAVIPNVSAPPSDGKQRREGTTSAIDAEGYLFASDHDPAEIVTIDPRSHAILARTPLQSSPDYLRYVARTHEIWATEPGKQQIEVFKLTTVPQPKLTADTTIHIAGGPESLEIDNARDHAFANLWHSKTVELSLTAHKVLAEWPNTCAHSHGIALDRADDHVFVGCGEGKVVALAADEGGKVIASAKAGAGIDIISYSPKLHHLYVPGAKAETLTIFKVAASGALTPTATYKTAPHAHCVTNDDAGHVFVCAPKIGTILQIDDR
ncbi:MAG TPA: hypothetical protein VF264_04920 [Rhodanobacteraceae bacterium]